MKRSIIYSIYTVLLLLTLSAFQNCGAAFEIGNNSSSSLILSHGEPVTSEEDIYTHGVSPLKNNSNTNATCNFLGQATLPLVTHYPSPGNFKIPTYTTTSGEMIYDTNNVDLPHTNEYIGNNYSTRIYAPNSKWDKTLSDILKQYCVKDLNSVKFVQGSIEVKFNGDLRKLIEVNKPYFQIIHGIIFKKNLFTVIIPPNWNTLTSSNLPTLFNGFYDINHNFMELEGPVMGRVLASAYYNHNKSGFGILWNGSGATGSRTMNNEAYEDLNDFLKIYLNDTNASPTKFASFGGSRGGITAMNVAAHPAVDSVSFAYSHVRVPVYKPFKAVEMVSTTIPLLLYSQDWSTGFEGSWRDSFVHPANKRGRKDFAGLNGRQSHLKAVSGTFQQSKLNAEFNLLTPNKIARLKRNNTQIYLSVSSHDFIVPSVDQFELFKDSMANDLNVEVRINYLIGHGGSLEARHLLLEDVYQNLILAPQGLIPQMISKNKITNYIAQPDGSYITKQNNDPILSVEIPRFIIDDSQPIIIASGDENSSYILLFKKGDTYIKHKLNLNNKGLAISKINKDAFYETGDYTFIGAYTLDASGKPHKKVQIKTTLKPDLPITTTRFKADIKPYLRNISSTIMTYIWGNKREKSYFDKDTSQGSNLGFIQTGTEDIPLEELKALVAKNENTPSAFTCSISSNQLANFSMSGSITPHGKHFGKTGHYFVAGYDVIEKEWHSFDGTKWLKYDNTENSILSIPEDPIQNKEVNPIFQNTDLSRFPGGQIYIGYGVGDKKTMAWNQMINGSQQKKMCSTLPATPAQYSCNITSRSLSSYSMTASITASSKEYNKDGFYFVSGYHPGTQKWYSFDGKIWQVYDGTTDSVLTFTPSKKLSRDGTGEQTIFDSANVLAFQDAEIYIGYGQGKDKKSALMDFLDNNKRKLCATFTQLK